MGDEAGHGDCARFFHALGTIDERAARLNLNKRCHHAEREDSVEIKEAGANQVVHEHDVGACTHISGINAKGVYEFYFDGCGTLWVAVGDPNAAIVAHTSLREK